jgi:hypothetical protein
VEQLFVSRTFRYPTQQTAAVSQIQRRVAPIGAVLALPQMVGRRRAKSKSQLPSVILRQYAEQQALEHDPEKWEPVFGKDHAQSKS